MIANSLPKLSPNEYNTVELIDVDKIKPSDDNNAVYGAVEHDEQMNRLINSIRQHGLLEPILVSSDGYIVSGHRRYYAMQEIGYGQVPVRVLSSIQSVGNRDFPRILVDCNPQRVKSVGAMIRESLLQDNDDPTKLIHVHIGESSVASQGKYDYVKGDKEVKEISERRKPFLTAAKAVIEKLRDYWPLSVRQVHYQMLNAPPLMQEPKQSKFGAEHYRYRNDDRSYDALVDLLTQARYTGEVNMYAIDDETRPFFHHCGFENISQFVDKQISGFLKGYHLNRQLNQFRHIEVLGEKGTLKGIIEPVCREYHVPLTLGRGYASIPVWRDMADRFRASEAYAMTLIVVSDYDPEGMDLAEDAIRSLKRFGVEADYHRVGVTADQIQDLGLQEDFNPAKGSSSRYKSFVERTGGKSTWEVEALPPEYLRGKLREGIESNMLMDVHRKIIEQEQRDAKELAKIRASLVENGFS
ncbi:ParB N-terminal domain-containing protein [Roseiconus lacunae]|uniref:ParB N-terminal domain-containing protein n=1 Tax=Roseiconus lacunae TaxID=2605694 RepID=UPI00308D8295|nr:ParB N-terminal domain-containing protein [Stieleria sp. HD01]